MWQISVDSILILRLFCALAWGFAWALFIYKARRGIELRQDHTWVTVVIGVGVDLLLAFPADWWVVAAVVSISSIGVIGFATFYPHHQPSGYTVIGYIEEATALCLKVIGEMENALDASENGKMSAAISRMLKSMNRAHRLMMMARFSGEFVKRRRAE